MTTALTRFDASLALAADCLRRGAESLGFALDTDPLRLDLPPLLGPNAPSSLTPTSLRTLAASYLQAELEQAGLIVAAGAIAEARAQLNIDPRAARMLEDYARHARTWYQREQREALFARVFGSGPRATRDEGGVNNEFPQVFASMCVAAVRYGDDFAYRGEPGAAREALFRRSASSVVLNLAVRQHGNTLVAARQIEDQLRAAIDILGDASIAAQFGVHGGLWDLLRNLYGDAAPDLGRILTRGQTGLRILNWLAGVIDELARPTPSRRIGIARDPLFNWCAQWLDANGLSVSRGAPAS